MEILHITRSLLLLSGLKFCSPSPLAIPAKPFQIKTIPSNFCYLPAKYGESFETFIEDCPSLDRYDLVPKPANFYNKHGVHPKVCCPLYLSPRGICTPSDPWCPNYVELTFDYDYGYDYETTEAVDYTMSETSTDASLATIMYGKLLNLPYTLPYPITLPDYGNLTECVAFSRCPALFDRPDAPEYSAVVCGYDVATSQAMVLCTQQHLTEDTAQPQQPRFPLSDGSPRPVEDKHDLCAKWKRNGGCDLDKNIIFDEEDPQNAIVKSHELFEFMQIACPATCEWTGDKGCVDEHPRCPEWARAGHCVTYPNTKLMALTCRESCGVCGFLSPFNKEEQVVGDLSYSDYTKNSFDCGRGKLLCEINGEDCDAAEEEELDLREDELGLRGGDGDRVKRQAEEDTDLWAGFSAGDGADYFCGGTIISDRFSIAAAHCYDDLGVAGKVQKIKTQTIRDKTGNIETIEQKRVFKHPLYKFPTLYNDVAIVELGRRIEYNYDKFGDSPDCMDQQKYDNVDKLATVQGYGLTEDGKSGLLLEANVTVISHETCTEYFRHNASTSDGAQIRRQLTNALPNGLTYGLLCAQGTQNENGTFRSSCKGDSGGPLKTYHDDRNTLIGIVSGGIGCGSGVPGWYTQVSFFGDWIDCVITTAKGGASEKAVKEKCDPVAKSLVPSCLESDDLIFDLRSSDPSTSTSSFNETFSLEICEDTS